QDLDRHRPLEPRIARFVDFAHAACAERGHDFVRAETCAGDQRHGLRANISCTGAGAPPPARASLMPPSRSAWPQALIPPPPSGATISYGPRRVPAVRANDHLPSAG